MNDTNYHTLPTEEVDFWSSWNDRYQHTLLSLEQIYTIGERLFGQRDACAVYDLTPSDAYERGIRLLGRTVLECCIDLHARRIAAGVRSYALNQGFTGPTTVIDLFAGSANLLYHVYDTMNAQFGIGFEASADVFQQTTANLAILQSPLTLVPDTWEAFQQTWAAEQKNTSIIILDPPWGDAYSDAGLDLRATTPPVPTVIRTLMPHVKQASVLWVIKTYEYTFAPSIHAITDQFAHHHLVTLNDAAPGANTGYLMCYGPV